MLARELNERKVVEMKGKRESRTATSSERWDEKEDGREENGAGEVEKEY